MKYASAPLLALLNSATDSFLMANCFTITLLNGYVYRCTDHDGAVVLGSNTFPGSGTAALISGMKYNIKRGMEVDEQTITIAATPAMTIDGVPFLAALASGLLDDATFQWDRAFFTAWGNPSVAVGTMDPLFYGRISSIDKLGRTQAEVKVKSMLVLLDRPYPSRSYAVSCQWVLYGYGCGLNRASFSGTATVASGSTLQQVMLTSASFTDSSPYDQGTIKFTSGNLAGQSFSIKGWNNSPLLVDLPRPLPQVPSVGSTVTMYWGCDHTTGGAGCSRFNNLTNFKGFPYVPPQSTGL